MANDTTLKVHFSSESEDWYAPPEIVERVVKALGAVDLDPCSNSGDAANGARSNGADLIRFVIVHDLLGWDQVPAEQRLGHRIDLIVVGAVGKGGALLDEVPNPWCIVWMGQVNIAGLDQRAYRSRSRDLPARGIHWQETGQLPREHLDHG